MKQQLTHKANQLLAELRANPDWKIDEKNFKQGYFKALEWVLQDTGIKEKFEDINLDIVISFYLI